VDWNNDGLKDLVVGERNGAIRIYLNTGTADAPELSGFTYLRVGGLIFQCAAGTAKPEIVDWNNDGKKDVLCGDNDGYVHLLLNTGMDENPVFSNDDYVMDGSGRLYVGDVGRASPVVVDWNMDGKKDLIVGELYGGLFYYENKGTDADPVFNGYTALIAGGSVIQLYDYARPEAVDWNGDGLNDLIVGQYDGTVVYFRALRPGVPWIETRTQSVQDADTDGFIEPGERCQLFLSLWNNGAGATNVTATLSATSSVCTVISNLWIIGNMPTGSAQSNNAAPFVMQIASNAPLGMAVPLNLNVVANGGAYTTNLSLTLKTAEPLITVVDVLLNDMSGTANMALNPGERAHMVVKLTNSGYRAENVVGHLSCGNSFISMVQSNSAFGAMERGSQVLNSAVPFCVDVAQGAWSNGVYLFSLDVSYDRAAASHRFNFFVGGEYRAGIDTNFSWIDTSGGTVVYLGDDYTSGSIPIGFNFLFYGKLYDNVNIDDNGYLVFENPGSAYQNIAIPDPSYPNSFVALFWDDLDTTYGTVRYLRTGTAPNRCWVAEWNQVQHYLYDASYAGYITCQVILNENGSIKFQYGPSSGTWTDGSSATIGIENQTGTDGILFSFNSSAVFDGLAVLFDTDGVVDSDADGLLTNSSSSISAVWLRVLKATQITTESAMLMN